MRVQITIPPNTSRDNPQVTRLLYTSQILQSEVIEIPKGHAYLTGLQLRAGYNGAVFLPEGDSNTEWITGDGRTINKKIKLSYSLPSFGIEIRAYNEDDTYPHSFYIDLD